MLLQKYSQLPTQYNTLEDGEGVLTLITTFLPSYIPIFKKFFGHSPVCFWKCAAYVFCLQDANFQWLTNNVRFQKISIPAPTPQDFPFQCIFEDPPTPQEFPEFLNRDFLPPSEIQSGFGNSKRRKWILTQLWNTVEFYYNSINFCQAYYSAKLLKPSSLQIMSLLFLCKLISLNIWVAKSKMSILHSTIIVKRS